MNTIDQAVSHVACSEHVRQPRDPHEWICGNAAKPVEFPWQHCREGACSHAEAPHDRLRGDDLTGSERDTPSIDRSDLGAQSCLDAKVGERLANYWACVSPDRGSHDRIVVDKDYPVLASGKGTPKLAWHLGRNFNAGKARAHDHYS
jgi:hypothetical protein